MIEHNPVYLYIYILRQCVVYGQRPEWMYVRNGIIWAAGMFVVGILIFKGMRMMWWRDCSGK